MITRGMFSRVSTGFNIINPNFIALEKQLNADDVRRIRDYVSKWNYYDGLHWEEIEETDKPEITENWCRRFVHKFASAEFNEGFTFKFDATVEEAILPYLNNVWDDNNGDLLMQELGQMKNVTGDAYIQVHYEPKRINGVLNPDFDDPFDEYEEGRIRLMLIPSSICFPQFKDGYDTCDMESCSVVFPVKVEAEYFGSGNADRYHIKRFVYTKEYITEYEDKIQISKIVNPYGVIPIVHFKNISLAGRSFGLSDLEDLIPLNMELNLKNSDVSEILDYHASPITAIFGARVSNLEKGANKIWGGLPKDAKIQNIELQSDLGASGAYRKDVKKSMHEIAGMPELATGSGEIVSNISGIALQIAFMPLTDTINMKRASTKKSIALINKLIIKIGKEKGLFKLPEGISNSLLYKHEVAFNSILPKDILLELEQIQLELKAGLENREGAMKRLKKDDIQKKMKDIVKERREFPMMYGVTPQVLTNGQILVNPETGEMITDNMEATNRSLDLQEKQAKSAEKTALATAKAIGNEGTTVGTASPQKSKAVGVNAKGGDVKVNSGIGNKNEGSKK